jgi:hypothetical protein
MATSATMATPVAIVVAEIGSMNSPYGSRKLLGLLLTYA